METTAARAAYSYAGHGLTSFFFLRNVFLPTAVALGLILIPSPVVLAAMIIGGHAHFLLAYLYQYRAKKMTPTYLRLAFLVFAAAVVYFAVSGETLPIFFAVSILFSSHFAHDEFTLHDEPWTFQKFTTFLGFVALFMTLTLDMVYHTPLLLVGVSVLVVTGVAVRLFSKAAAPSRTEYYLWFLSALVMLMALHIIPVAYGAITTFIIILHFFNWMIGYGIRVSKKPPQAKRYWADTALIMGFSLASYLLLALSGHPLFGLFFSVTSYYAWAIGHIILSFFLARIQ